MSREAVLAELAEAILNVRRPHPTRVAIDGQSAAGKSTLAEELAPLIAAAGRPCVPASIDDFHPPGHAARSASGGYTAASYYDEAFDYAAFRRLVLDPLGAGGDRRCRLRVWDSLHDRPYPEEWREVTADAVAIIEAAFAFRPELASSWDYAVWLEIDSETSLARARRRDVAWVGSEEAVIERHNTRNRPLHEHYVAETRAPDRADAVIDNCDVQNPRIVRMSPGRTSDQRRATSD